MIEENTTWHELSRLAALWLLVASIQTAFAVSAEPTGLRDRFPAGSIQSAKEAELALATVAAERQRAETEYKLHQRACLKKFLTNRCLEEERDRHQLSVVEADAVELEANRYQRSRKSDETDERRRKANEERIKNADAVAAKDARKRQDYLENQAEAERQRVVREAADAQKMELASKARKPSASAAEKRPVDNPEARRLNAARQSVKEKEAAEHRQTLARERAEKVAARAERQKAREAKQRAAKEAESAGGNVSR